MKKVNMHLISFSLLLVFQASVVIPGSAYAQETLRKVGVPDTEVHEFRASNGMLLDLYVGLPSGYVSDGSIQYPIIYSTDASVGFAAEVQIFRLLAIDDGEEERPLPPVILVGVDRAQSSGVDSGVTRYVDLTPTSDPEFEQGASAAYGVPVKSGGADTFLAILKDEIIPWVEARYPAAPDRGISGYSLGGLFAIHALLDSPETFKYYFIGSPSLWWNGGVIFDREEVYASKFEDLDARVYMSVGSQEGTMVPEMLRMVETLEARGYEHLEIEGEILDGETHLSGAFLFASRSARWMFGIRTMDQ